MVTQKETEIRLSLVEQNYQHLDKRITSVEEKLDQVHTDIVDGQQSTVRVLIGAAGTVVAGLLSTIVVLLLNT